MKNFYFPCSYLLSLVFIVLVSEVSVGQQLDQIGKKDAVKVSGGFGVNQNLYLSNGIENRFNPYSYVVSGNLNVSAYGFSVPVSFAYTNQKLTYNAQPFNIIGLSPSYKSLRLHGGYRNMSFSPYTLAGHNFLGGGVEWSHKGFHIAAMSGRLLRAVEYDSTQNTNPVYARYGGGLKVGFAKGGEEISFISFYAKDLEGSIEEPPSFTGVRPEENQVYSIIFKKRLSEKIVFHFEGATSAWTKDLGPEVSNGQRNGLRNLYIMPFRDNTVFYNAFKTGVSFGLKKGALGVNFERVEPEYRTMGAYFINSDFQNLTANYSTTLFKDKLSLGLDAGFQRDDLENTKMSRMNRFVGSANVSFRFSEKLNASGSYSNFNSFTNIKPVDQAYVQNTPYDRLDTMNYAQISQSFNANVNIKPLENTRLIHNLSLGGNYNDVFNKSGETNIASNMASAFAAYNISWKESGLNLGFNLNGNRNQYVEGTSYFTGLGINCASKLIKEKLRASISGNVSGNYEDGDLTAYLFSIVNSYSMKVGKHHSLSLNLRYTGRSSQGQAQYSHYTSTFQEFMGNLGYNFSF